MLPEGTKWRDSLGHDHTWSWRHQQSRWRGLRPLPANPDLAKPVVQPVAIDATTVDVTGIDASANGCTLFRNGKVAGHADPATTSHAFTISPEARAGDVFTATQATAAAGESTYSDAVIVDAAVAAVGVTAAPPAPTPAPPEATKPKPRRGLFSR